MAGPGIRAYRFAKELARDNDITLAVPFATDLDVAADGIELVQIRPDDDTGLTALVKRVRHRGRPAAAGADDAPPREDGTRTVYDLYAPVTVEQLALDSHREPLPAATISGSERTASCRRSSSARATPSSARASASATSGSARSPRSAASTRIATPRDPDVAEPDRRRAVRDRAGAARSGEPAVKGVRPGHRRRRQVLVWSGGIWDWFDPLTVIRAVHELAQRRDDVRLVLPRASSTPTRQIGEMTMAERAVRLARGARSPRPRRLLQLGWVPYEERGRYLLEADSGSRRISTISKRASLSHAHARLLLGRPPDRDNHARRFAERTRGRARARTRASTSRTSRAGSLRSRHCSMTIDARSTRERICNGPGRARMALASSRRSCVTRGPGRRARSAASSAASTGGATSVRSAAGCR